MTDYDWLDIYADPEDGDEASAILDNCIQQIEYHQRELQRWKRLKSLAERAIPKTPLEEMLEIARNAWQQ